MLPSDKRYVSQGAASLTRCGPLRGVFDLAADSDMMPPKSKSRQIIEEVPPMQKRSARLLWPVEIVSVGAPEPTDDDRSGPMIGDDLGGELAAFRVMASLPWRPPWPWYPAELPHWGIAAPGEAPRVWFAGRPQGQEKKVFEEIILAVGRRRDALSPLTRANLDTLAAPVVLAVLTTPDCPRCAQAVHWAHAMALYQPKIVSVAVMLDACWKLTETLKISGVPVIFVGSERLDGIADEWRLGQRVAAVAFQASQSLGKTSDGTGRQREG